ncbi:MAG: rod shape-determining protein MreC [Deltaproteobacteria bacterium]|nr:rod shape-determining protein MreC [Deltaproteobacteria bacterium]
MSTLFSHFRQSLTLLALLLLSLVLMTSQADRKAGGNDYLSILFEAVSWVETGLSTISSGALGIYQGYFHLVDVKRENQALRKRVALLENRLHILHEKAVENQRLRKLLHFQETRPFALLPAGVVGKDFNSWSRTLVINQGSRSGVQTGMAVVRPEGVVGRILTTSNHFSLVQLILDSNSDIPAIVERTRAEGIVSGKIPDRCRIKYLNRLADIVVGDRVLSSGLGGIYPKGLIIGTVNSVHKKKYGLFQEVIITPAVDFAKVEEVFVVKNRRLSEYDKLMKSRQE